MLFLLGMNYLVKAGVKLDFRKGVLKYYKYKDELKILNVDLDDDISDLNESINNNNIVNLVHRHIATSRICN